VPQNRVLRTVFGCTKEEVKGGWRKVHNEEVHNLYSSPNTMRVIKLRMRWVERVACMADIINTKF